MEEDTLLLKDVDQFLICSSKLLQEVGRQLSKKMSSIPHLLVQAKNIIENKQMWKLMFARSSLHGRFENKLVKFIYSEKATKFCEIFPLLLTTVHTVKS